MAIKRDFSVETGYGEATIVKNYGSECINIRVGYEDKKLYLHLDAGRDLMHGLKQFYDEYEEAKKG